MAEGTVDFGGSGLRFPPPKPFTGDEHKFEEFNTKLKSFLNMANPNFRQHMIVAQDSEEPLPYENFTPQVQVLATQLQSALVALCEGPAYKIVTRDAECVNGFESWRRLWARYKPIKRAKTTNRMTKILNWKFDTGKDFENSFNDWEAEITKYESEMPEGTQPIQSEIKAGILLGRTTGPLQEHLLLNTDVSTPYEEIRIKILNYFKTGTLFNTLKKI